MTRRAGDARAPVDRRGAQPPAGGVPRRHDLEDPVPREPGPARPRAHAVGLPQVLRGRHRAAALDPPPAARELPAAQGDQGPPRRGRERRAARRAGRRRAVPAASRGGDGGRARRRRPARPTGRRRSGWPTRPGSRPVGPSSAPERRRAPVAAGAGVANGRSAARSRGSSPLDVGPTSVSLTRAELLLGQRPGRGRDPGPRVLRAARGPQRRRRRLLRRGRARRRPDGGRRSSPGASSPATCGCTRWPPSARPASSSRSSCRC